MNLFYSKFGSGQPIIIVHGLLGCSDNWVTIGKSLSENFEVFLLDQRNHGKSPHNQNIDYDILADDLHNFITVNSISKPILMGHSMGGKVVMKYAKDHSEDIKSIIIIDIAPKTYNINSPSSKLINAIIDNMINVDFNHIKNRTDVENILSGNIKDIRILLFILKNLKRNTDNTYKWAINIKSIKDNFNNFLQSPFENNKNKIDIPTLFLRGAKSDYITFEDILLIKNIFSSSQIITIPDAGHWIHTEQPELLISTIKLFLL